MVDIVAARMLISDVEVESTPITVIRRIFVIMYPDVSRTSRRVAVPMKRILGKICGYAICFKKKKEVDGHSEVIAR